MKIKTKPPNGGQGSPEERMLIKMMIYPNRYQAEKNRVKGLDIVCKVCGGYAVMTYAEYRDWKKQK